MSRSSKVEVIAAVWFYNRTINQVIQAYLVDRKIHRTRSPRFVISTSDSGKGHIFVEAETLGEIERQSHLYWKSQAAAISSIRLDLRREHARKMKELRQKIAEIKTLEKQIEKFELGVACPQRHKFKIDFTPKGRSLKMEQ